jgi:hypothetical protein
VLRAAERGAACNVDVSQGFDVFAHANTSLAELRASLDIPPLDVAAGTVSASA